MGRGGRGWRERARAHASERETEAESECEIERNENVNCNSLFPGEEAFMYASVRIHTRRTHTRTHLPGPPARLHTPRLPKQGR